MHALCVALVVAALPLPSVLLSFVPLSRRCAELAELNRQRARLTRG